MIRPGRRPRRRTPRGPRRRERSPYDQLAKGLANDALSDVGQVETEVEVLAAVQRMDLWHEPDPARAAGRLRLGLLGQLTSTPCQFEPFARTPGLRQVRACLRKQLHWHHDRERRAKRRLPLPRLCITSPGQPTNALILLGLEATGSGIYQSAPGLGIYVLVLSEVPRNRETLLLRLMGSGRILREAIAELVALPDGAWEKELAIPWLLRLGFEVPGHGLAKEAVMASEVREWFEGYKKELVEKGVKKGVKKGRVDVLAQLCAWRLGRALSPAERTILAKRVARLDAGRIGELLVGASPQSLEAWLADPAAA